MFSQLINLQDNMKQLVDQGTWNIVQHPKIKDMWRRTFTFSDAVKWTVFWDVRVYRVHSPALSLSLSVLKVA